MQSSEGAVDSHNDKGNNLSLKRQKVEGLVHRMVGDKSVKPDENNVNNVKSPSDTIIYAPALQKKLTPNGGEVVLKLHEQICPPSWLQTGLMQGFEAEEVEPMLISFNAINSEQQIMSQFLKEPECNTMPNQLIN